MPPDPVASADASTQPWDAVRLWGSARSAVAGGLVARLLADEAQARAQTGLDLLDAGGGTGSFAVPLARLGHRVVVVDPSPDSLATLARRAVEAGVESRVRGVQGDLSLLSDVVAGSSADAVLCHSVLEVVEDPGPALVQAAAALRPGGVVSVLVATRAAAVLGRALAGRFDDAAACLSSPAGCTGAEPVARRFDRAGAIDLLIDAGFAVEHVHGVRVVSDLVPGALLDRDPQHAAALLRLEELAGTVADLQAVAAQLHLLARRPD